MTAFMLAQAELGTVPDWLAAVGTLLAFLVALRLLFKELAAHREQEEDRRRNQASLVAAWMMPKPLSRTEERSAIVIRNGSDEPVFDGWCVLVASTSRFASERKQVFDWEFRWRVLPPQETLEDELDLPQLLTPPWDARIRLSFTDAAGRRWTRYPDGQLVQRDRATAPLSQGLHGRLDCRGAGLPRLLVEHPARPGGADRR